MTLKRTILIGAVCAVAGGATTATANISHVLGNGGPNFTFDATCRRASGPATPIPMGSSWQNGGKHFVRVAGSLWQGQIKCLIHRRDARIDCVKALGPVPPVSSKSDHGVGKPADWLGVDDLRAYLAGLRLCDLGSGK